MRERECRLMAESEPRDSARERLLTAEQPTKQVRGRSDIVPALLGIEVTRALYEQPVVHRKTCYPKFFIRHFCWRSG